MASQELIRIRLKTSLSKRNLCENIKEYYSNLISPEFKQSSDFYKSVQPKSCKRNDIVLLEDGDDGNKIKLCCIMEVTMQKCACGEHGDRTKLIGTCFENGKIIETRYMDEETRVGKFVIWGKWNYACNAPETPLDSSKDGTGIAASERPQL